MLAQLDLCLSAADDAHDSLETDSVNLSLGGPCVRAARSYPVGTQLRLQLVLVDDALELQGVVAWSGGELGAPGGR